MGVQFIEQSSASSVGYTEKATKTRADPSLCYPGIFAGYGRGWATAAVHCCHPGCCGIPVKEGNAALAVCAHGWEVGGAVWELLVPHREDGSCMGQHGGVPGQSPTSRAAAAEGIAGGTVVLISCGLCPTVLPLQLPGWFLLRVGTARPALLPEHGSTRLRAGGEMFGWQQL